MIEENALVVKTSTEDKQYAWVQTQRKSACGTCSAKSACGTQILSRIFGQKLSRIKVINSCNAKPGDYVVIGLEDQALLKGSFLLYFVPLIFLIIFSLIGTLIAKSMSLPTGYIDLSSIVSATLGMLFGILAVRVYSVLGTKGTPYEAKIIRILPNFNISCQ